MGPDDAQFMRIALRLARRGLGRCWPNPSVGAVVVQSGAGAEIVGRGWTRPGGRPHAETVALEEAGDQARGATLYVTLEPCSHHGVTPPCVEAILAAGIRRVVCAIDDPDPRVGGRGLARLERAGVEVATGVLGPAARHIAAGHILRQTQRRPFVQLKLAVGSDGRIAAGDGAPVWVTGEAARANGHLLRARADAILIGRGTVMADDPSLTCRLPGLGDRSPIRVVLDSGLAIPEAAAVLRETDRVPTWVVCADSVPRVGRSALERAGARVFPVAAGASGRLDLASVLRCLADCGITRLLVEGGPNVARSFVDSRFVDEAVFFIGHAPVGAGGLKPFVSGGLEWLVDSGQFRCVDQRDVGPDRRSVYRRES